MRASGTAPVTDDARGVAGTIDDRGGGTAVGRTAVEDELDPVSEQVLDLRRVAPFRPAGDVRGGRRQRAELARERARSLVVGHAQADGGGPGVRTSGSLASARRSTTMVSPPGQQAAPSAVAATPIVPSRPACARSSSSRTMPLSGGRCFTWNSRSIPPGVSSATAMP